MGLLTGFRCVVCGHEAPAPASAGTCPRCGDPFATLEAQFDLGAAARTLTRESLAARPNHHWRYEELLPVDRDEAAFAWPVGVTPLLPAPALAEWAGLARVRLKDETRHPTASLKDRAVADLREGVRGRFVSEIESHAAQIRDAYKIELKEFLAINRSKQAAGKMTAVIERAAGTLKTLRAESLAMIE